MLDEVSTGNDVSMGRRNTTPLKNWCVGYMECRHRIHSVGNLATRVAAFVAIAPSIPVSPS